LDRSNFSDKNESPLRNKSHSYRFPSAQSIFSIVDFNSLPLPSPEPVAGEEERENIVSEQQEEEEEKDFNEPKDTAIEHSQSKKQNNNNKSSTVLKQLSEKLNHAFQEVDILGEGTIDVANFCTAMIDLGLHEFDSNDGQNIFNVLDKNDLQTLQISETIEAVVWDAEDAPVCALRLKLMEKLGLSTIISPEETSEEKLEENNKTTNKKADKKVKNIDKKESTFNIDAMEEIHLREIEKDKTPLSPIYKAAQVVQKLNLNQLQNSDVPTQDEQNEATKRME